MLRLAGSVMVMLSLSSLALADEEPYGGTKYAHLHPPQLVLGATAYFLYGSAGTLGDIGFEGLALMGEYRVRPNLYVVAQVLPHADLLADGGSGITSESAVWGGRLGIGWEHWGDLGSYGVQVSTGFTHTRSVRSDGLISEDDIIETSDSIPFELRFPLRLRLVQYVAIEVAPFVLGSVAVRGDDANGLGVAAGAYAMF